MQQISLCTSVLSVVHPYLATEESGHGNGFIPVECGDDLKQNIASYLESARIDMTVKEVLDEIDTSEYCQNPRSPFPFVIRVEANYLWRSGEPLQGRPSNTQTHLWFYGYISDPL